MLSFIPLFDLDFASSDNGVFLFPVEDCVTSLSELGGVVCSTQGFFFAGVLAGEGAGHFCDSKTGVGVFFFGGIVKHFLEQFPLLLLDFFAAPDASPDPVMLAHLF